EEINDKFSDLKNQQDYKNLSEEEKEKIAKHKDFLLVRVEIENNEE
ncbi:392_t:CDS:1, partial [Paraglomus brasilianum]